MDLAILGYGVVGSGVAQLLEKNRSSIAQRSAQPSLQLKYILDIREFPEDPFEQLFTRDIGTIVNDPNVRIVAETIGGLHPAFEFVTACLQAGKSVVTSNKELVAVKGCELLRLARQHNANFLFEGSVGGGIPVIRPLTQCLAGNIISEVAGILNGTTNFILTRMIEDAMPFQQALRLAQENGYAESDPSADINGDDACRKICILAALSFGRHVLPQQVRTQGIAALALEDVAYAAQYGCTIKLIAQAKQRSDGRVSALVAPMLVPFAGNMLAGVSGVYNAVLIKGDAVGDVVFYGQGAGKMPTASAVTADIIDCAKHMQHPRFFAWEEGAADYVAPADEDIARLYVRAACSDTAAARHAVQQAFPGVKFLEPEGANLGDIAFVTPAAQEKAALAALSAMPQLQIKTQMRIAEL